MFISDIFKRKKGAKTEGVEITNIYVKLGGDMHGLGGRTVKAEAFDLTIPYSNRLANDLLPDNLKGPPITISSISAEKPFSLLSVSPSLPQTVEYMSKTVFSLRINAPRPPYSGPLVIKFETDSSENVNVRIERITLINADRSYNLEDSASDMTLKKSQIFKKDIQLYKILSYNQHVEAIEINKPFKLEETRPKPPFNIDKKDSYIAELYIRCPEFNYTGPMEITFKQSA